MVSAEVKWIHRYTELMIGPIIRIGPNEYSVDDPDSVQLIYGSKGGFVKVTLKSGMSFYNKPSLCLAINFSINLRLGALVQVFCSSWNTTYQCLC
jgi:hypothetical protein